MQKKLMSFISGSTFLDISRFDPSAQIFLSALHVQNKFPYIEVPIQTHFKQFVPIRPMHYLTLVVSRIIAPVLRDAAYEVMRGDKVSKRD